MVPVRLVKNYYDNKRCKTVFIISHSFVNFLGVSIGSFASKT